MNVLIVGSGAREHCLAWKIRQSPRLDSLFVAPGNAGTAAIAENLPVKASDLEGIARAAREQRVDLAVVGPEDPLAAGLVDRLAVEGIAAFGPSKAAAEIESSKVFAKELMARHGIPTAPFAVFERVEDARAYLSGGHGHGPYVVKADGLAAGKGALVTDSTEEALAALESLMVRRELGEAGARVVIEERLSGREVTAHAFTDGRTVVHMPFSCDHKPVFDGDRGPNTGGMGVYSPPSWLDEATAERIRRDATEATVQAMMEEGRPYRGLFYPGMMVTADGPQVLEFNCRFGDPEAQVTLPRLKSDLAEILSAVATDRLQEVDVQWSDEACVGVVMASGGYPGEYETGFPIAGLGSVDDDALVFHAGTRLDEEGGVVTSGGRVLTVAALGASLNEARGKAYRNIQHIHFSRCHYRRDIAAPSQDAVAE